MYPINYFKKFQSDFILFSGSLIGRLRHVNNILGPARRNPPIGTLKSDFSLSGDTAREMTCEKTGMLLVIAGALSALFAASATAEPKAGADRCLTTLYNYPAEAEPARASRPLITLEAKAPSLRPGILENFAKATSAKPWTTMVKSQAATTEDGISPKIQ